MAKGAISVNLIKPKVNCGFSISKVFVFDVSVVTFSANVFFFSLPPQANSNTATGKIQVVLFSRDFIFLMILN